jgi:hypothetical protein
LKEADDEDLLSFAAKKSFCKMAPDHAPDGKTKPTSRNHNLLSFAAADQPETSKYDK